jgi:hypothetical protein
VVFAHSGSCSHEAPKAGRLPIYMGSQIFSALCWSGFYISYDAWAGIQVLGGMGILAAADCLTSDGMGVLCSQVSVVRLVTAQWAARRWNEVVQQCFWA